MERGQHRRGRLQALARYIARHSRNCRYCRLGGGDNLALYLIDNDAGGGFLRLPRYEYSPTYPPPQLVVEWTIAATGNEIDAVTGSGAATLATHGAADVTLGAITGAAVGGVISGAAGAATLDAITGAAAATLLTHADADATLGAATSSGGRCAGNRRRG
jgi:hypothetical protein